MKPSSVIVSHIGPRVPRRGNAFSRGFGRLVLRLMGWQFVGAPPNTPRFVCAAVPHTSNWDGFIFLMAMLACGLDLRWVGKHSLFTGPMGRILLWLGGLPVNRQLAGDFAAGVAATFARHPQLAVVIAPEGTRARTARWKTGFHRIAREAGVPVVVGYMDYRHKRVVFGPALDSQLSLPDMLTQIVEFLADITPRHPQRFSLPETFSKPQ